MEQQRQKLARLRQLRADYAAWQRLGMDALERGDLDALQAAIKGESDIIVEQTQLLHDVIAWNLAKARDRD